MDYMGSFLPERKVVEARTDSTAGTSYERLLHRRKRFGAHPGKTNSGRKSRLSTSTTHHKSATRVFMLLISACTKAPFVLRLLFSSSSPPGVRCSFFVEFRWVGCQKLICLVALSPPWPSPSIAVNQAKPTSLKHMQRVIISLSLLTE